MSPAIRKPKHAAKASPEQAGYMELSGARKDAQCEIVRVPGGVSSQKGCCNLFDPDSGASQFRCGTCEHISHG